MTPRPMKAIASSLIGITIMFVSIAAFGPVSARQPEAVEAPAQPATGAPYAQTTWVKLGELVPMETDGTDVYVRLIAIEGALLY